MFNKLKSNVCKCIRTCCKDVKTRCNNKMRMRMSALFVTNDKACKTTSVIAPFINLNELSDHLKIIENSVSSRNLSFDLKALKSKWITLCKMCDVKSKLIQNKNLILTNLSKVKEERIKDNVKVHLNLIKDDLKFISSLINNLERVTILEGLQLPNSLHSFYKDKGMINEEIIQSFSGGSELNSGKEQKISHQEIGEKLNVLKFVDPVNYYLLNDGVVFEHALLNYFASGLHNNISFISFSNTDFCKRVIMEGVGTVEENELNSCFSLQNVSNKENVENESENEVFLGGGASLNSFCGFHSKSSIDKKALPLRYLSQSRNLCYSLSKSNLIALFNVIQSSGVNIFIGCCDEEEMMNEFNSVLRVTLSLYKQFNLKFQCTYLPPTALNLSESLKVTFQIFSPFHNQFIQVGHLATSHDFISKRLRMHYHQTKSNPHFLYVLSGNIVQVAPFFATFLEYNENAFHLPTCLLDYTF